MSIITIATLFASAALSPTARVSPTPRWSAMRATTAPRVAPPILVLPLASQLRRLSHGTNKLLPPAYALAIGQLAYRATTRSAPGWPVQAALAALTILDFGPTGTSQHTDALSASAMAGKGGDLAMRARTGRWMALVRLKVLGELYGLLLAVRSPCVGAAIVLLSHQLFWAGGAAKARVRADGTPAPLPPPVAAIIWKADAVVLTFALLGAFGPSSAARRAGTLLFTLAGGLVCLEQVPKRLRSFRKAPPSPSPPSPSPPADGAPQPRTPPPPQMALAADERPSVDNPPSDEGIWAEQWWPLCFAAHTSKAEPVPMKLLGAPLVVWWDAVGGAWRCTLDRCAHRLAPLSEGRIADDGRCIECPYHGWAFDGESGQCTRIPQQPTPTISDRATIPALPTIEAQGIVWAWAGPLFEGAAPHPPVDGSATPTLVEAIELPGVAHSDYSRDLYMDASTLCENVMDPAHLPFTHHDTISKRDKAQPIPFANLSPLTASGFSADRPTEGWPGKVSFVAPHLVLAETHRAGAAEEEGRSVGGGRGAFSDWNVVYAVPTEPGRCRLLVRVVFEVARMKPPLKWIIGFAFTRQPTWLTHLGNHVILEDDNPFLHAQGHTYRDGRDAADAAPADADLHLAPGWQRRLYMPTTSDAMVIAYRRWLDKFTGGRGAPWSRYSARSVAAQPWRRASREEVLERFDSHVAHCSACRGALTNLIRGRRAADAAVAVALMLGACATRLRPHAMALAAVAYAVARACATLEGRMRVGRYPPPRNVS